MEAGPRESGPLQEGAVHMMFQTSQDVEKGEHAGGMGEEAITCTNTPHVWGDALALHHFRDLESDPMFFNLLHAIRTYELRLPAHRRCFLTVIAAAI